MKTKAKIISSLLVFVLTLSAFNVFTPMIAGAIDDAKTEWALERSLENSENCVDFIEENFSRVVSEYNAAHQENGLVCCATSIEGRSQIYITDSDKYGIYLDFDGNNGYLLVTENYLLYEFEPQGDLSYLKNVELAYYSSFDGFMYLDEETNTLERYEYVDTSSVLLDSSVSVSESQSVGSSASSSGKDDKGYIYNIDEYVNYYYPEYECVERYMATNYQFINQYGTSVIVRYKDGAPYYSENNCVINSTYSMMNDWRRRGMYTWLPSGTINYRSDVFNDAQYKKYKELYGDEWESNQLHLDAIPELYMELREYAIDCGYEPKCGMQFADIATMVNRVGASRGYRLSMLSSSTFNDDIQNLLKNNKTCLITTTNGTVYKNHAMALFGYVKYEYTSGWWIFATTETKYFFVVDDGHHWEGNTTFISNFNGVNTPACYFDPNTSDNPTVSFYYLANFLSN